MTRTDEECCVSYCLDEFGWSYCNCRCVCWWDDKTENIW